MPITYSDQFFVIDPGAPPAGGTALTVQNFDYIDENEDGLIGTTAGDTFNGLTVTSVWVGDTITMNIPGTGNVTISGVTFYTSGGPAVFTPTGGAVLQNGTFVSSTFVSSSTQIPVSSLAPACFTPGTRVMTIAGWRKIETLTPGTKVKTRDNGWQPLVSVAQRTVCGLGDYAPVRFAKGVLGNTEPLIVSPQHRMVLSGWQAQLHTGLDEVLVAAVHLVNGSTIRRIKRAQVTYMHLVFDSHQIVYAAGIPSESYFPGSASAGSEVAVEFAELFPELDAESMVKLARPTGKRFEAHLLAGMSASA